MSDDDDEPCPNIEILTAEQEREFLRRRVRGQQREIRELRDKLRELRGKPRREPVQGPATILPLHKTVQ
jgi:hypothetical protein